MSDTLAGTFATSHDADGNLDTLTYPGGLVATTNHNSAGTATSLRYSKGGTTWLHFDRQVSAQDEVRIVGNPTGTRNYTYDGGGRLRQVEVHGGTNCTRRTYSFDSNTNRTALVSKDGTHGLAVPRFAT